ncbi:MAG: hypothetical protein QQW96_11305 [Tychonema bourrellyi B0820]|nr:hypothetical protein [Tychonema bourrellyi B0820]
MVRQFLVSPARTIGTRTLPKALRFMANQLEDVGDLGGSNRQVTLTSADDLYIAILNES